MTVWNPSLIPRKSFPAKNIGVSYDDDYNIPVETETNFTVENASAQPSTGHDTQASLQGYKDKRVYTVYTTTPLTPSDEGGSSKGDLIEIETGVWFRVVKVKNWAVGVQTHYEALCVEVNER